MTAHQWVSSVGEYSYYSLGVLGGKDSDGSDIYVGRAQHEGDLIPAKVIPDRETAYVSWNGEEHQKSEWEILYFGKFDWKPGSNGSLPSTAFAAGQTASGEALFVGRVNHNGSQTVGKIQPSHGCLYIPYDGQELSFRDYEVLVKVE